MRDDARVAQRRRLDGVLVGEGRSEQEPALRAQLGVGVEPVGDPVGVVAEGADQVAVAIAEPLDAARRARAARRPRRARGSWRRRPIARDSLAPTTSWPATNSWATTRDGSGSSRSSLRSTSASPLGVTTAPVSTTRACWRVADQGDGRLGALVEVDPGRLEPVVAAAGGGVPHRAPVSLSPSNHAAAIRTPAVQRGSPVTAAARAQASASVATSIGCWSKPGASPGPEPPAGVTDRCPSTVSRSSSQPSRCTPSSTSAGRSRADPAASKRIGQHRVGVGETGLGPGPRRVGGRVARSASAASERSADAARVAWMRLEDGSGAEGGVGHRTGPRRPSLGASLEVRQGVGAKPVRSSLDGDAERPEAPAPAVLDGSRAVPAAGRGASVPRVRRSRPARRRRTGTRSRVELAHHGRIGSGSRNVTTSSASDVVGAVAVLAPGLRVAGVLEGAVAIGERVEVVEGWARPSCRAPSGDRPASRRASA